MRILAMVFHFPPISGGGVVVIVDIINKLAELGNNVTVLTPELDWSGERYEPKINPTIKVIKTETPSKSNIKVAARRCQYNMKEKALELRKQEKFAFVFTFASLNSSLKAFAFENNPKVNASNALVLISCSFLT